MADLVPVEVPCGCPERPHEHDTIYLRPVLGLAAGMAIERAVRDFWAAKGRNREDAILGALVEYYVVFGVAGWTLDDPQGRPLEVTEETIREHLLNDYSRARLVADKADELYKEPVIGPLLRQAVRSSRATSNSGSTSATSATPKRPKRSKRSSTSTTPTDGTGTTSTSPAGGSNS